MSKTNKSLVYLLRFPIGFKKIGANLISHPIRSKTKTNRASFALFFPRFASATRNDFEFCLVRCIVCLLVREEGRAVASWLVSLFPDRFLAGDIVLCPFL